MKLFKQILGLAGFGLIALSVIFWACVFAGIAFLLFGFII